MPSTVALQQDTREDGATVATGFARLENAVSWQRRAEPDWRKEGELEGLSWPIPREKKRASLSSFFFPNSGTRTHERERISF